MKELAAAAEASGVVLWLVDAELQLLDESGSLAAFAGLAADEAAGRGWLAAIHPDDRAAFEAAAHGARWEIEHRMRRPGGRYTRVRTRGVASDGGVVCALDEVWADEAVRRSEERLRLATDAARVAVWEYDFVAGQMTRTENHDALYGLPWQTVWQLDVFTDATHPDDRERSSRTVMEACAPGGADDYAVDFRVVWPDGSVHWLACTGHVLTRDAAGAATVVRGALIDVTRLKEIEGELRAAVALRDEFLQIASHELRTPLMTLALKLEAMVRSAPDTMRPHAEVVRRQTDRLITLVENLLDVARLTDGRLTLDRVPVALDDAVRAIADERAAELQRAGVELTLALAPGIVGTWDRNRIEQVLRNLLDNAIKYGRGQPIAIEAAASGAIARVAVRDQGIGIEAEVMPRIFDKFERAPAARGFRGLGLGLYVVRQIVELHGGRVAATSTPGAGTEVVVELPLG